MEETEGVIQPLKQTIADAVRRLEEQIATAESEEAPQDEITKAKEALAQGKAVAEPGV